MISYFKCIQKNTNLLYKKLIKSKKKKKKKNKKKKKKKKKIKRLLISKNISETNPFKIPTEKLLLYKDLNQP